MDMEQRSNPARSGILPLQGVGIDPRNSIVQVGELSAEIARSFIPATTAGRALNDLRVPPCFYWGIAVDKVCANGRAGSRILTFSRGNFMIFITRMRIPGARRAKREFERDGATYDAESTPQTAQTVPWFMKEKFLNEERGNYRHVDVTDITAVHSGFICSRKLEYRREKYLAVRRYVDPLTRSVLKRLKWFRRKKFDEESIVSIVHGDGKTLDLIIRNKRDRMGFLDTLHRIREVYHGAKVYVEREQLLVRHHWYEVDVNRNAKMEVEELIKLMVRVNLGVQEERDIKEQYKVFISNIRKKHENFYSDMLDTSVRQMSLVRFRKQLDGLIFDECVDFIQRQKLLTRENCNKTVEDEIWDKVFGNVDLISVKDFQEIFLCNTQKEIRSENDIYNFFSDLNGMNLDRSRFAAYLHSDTNGLFDPDCLKVDMLAMNEPLSYYWINTSHNTYLTGGQLNSESSVEMYMRAMRRGCKCLELDCWDGDKEKNIKGENIPIPIVYHGHTGTSKIRFEDIIRCVKGFLDENPQTYPMILSLENHCSWEYQDQMAAIMNQILADKLHIPDLSNMEADLPSPASLRGKVIIKGKRPPVLNNEEDDNLEPVEDDMVCILGNKEIYPQVLPALAAMTLFHGVKFKNFELSIKEPRSHMHSINESKMIKILSLKKESSAASMWRQYNQHHMTRTYPSGSRVNSSNYDPMLPWLMGCQLVALNFQESDAHLIVNDGRFRENGGCGYVPKPRWLITETSPAPPQKLQIRIISGSCLPKPKGKRNGVCIDPYVKITLHDVVHNERGVLVSNLSLRSLESMVSFTRETAKATPTGRHKTRNIHNNGFCPVWNEESFSKFQISFPDVAILQFTLGDAKGSDLIIAEAAIPVNRLRNGYRCIKLFDRNGERAGIFAFATLLVEVKC